MKSALTCSRRCGYWRLGGPSIPDCGCDSTWTGVGAECWSLGRRHRSSLAATSTASDREGARITRNERNASGHLEHGAGVRVARRSNRVGSDDWRGGTRRSSRRGARARQSHHLAGQPAGPSGREPQNEGGAAMAAIFSERTASEQRKSSAAEHCGR